MFKSVLYYQKRIEKCEISVVLISITEILIVTTLQLDYFLNLVDDKKKFHIYIVIYIVHSHQG